MDDRIFARFHLDAGIGDAVIQPVEIIDCRDWLSFAGIAASTGSNAFARAAVCGKTPRLYIAKEFYQQPGEGPHRSRTPDPIRWAQSDAGGGCAAPHIRTETDPQVASGVGGTATGLGAALPGIG
jgi:hypothetical protein